MPLRYLKSYQHNTVIGLISLPYVYCITPQMGESVIWII